VLALTDVHGNQVGQFTAAGASLAASQAYDPWGNVTATAGGMTGLLGYQSAWTDAAAGKDLMGARWYDPGAGDFTSADTVAVSPDPDEAAGNPFAYAADEPLDLVDPTGHYIVPEGGAEGAGTSERIGNGATSASNYIADQTTARIVEKAVISAPNDAAKAAAARAAVAKVDAEQATAAKAAKAAAAKAARAAAAKKASEEQAEKEAAAKAAAAKAKLKPTDGRGVPGPSSSVITQVGQGAVGGAGTLGGVLGTGVSAVLGDGVGGEVAVDANSLIGALDHGQMDKLIEALAGRAPVLSPQAVMEYLAGGDSEPLVDFLTTTGGRIGSDVTDDQATALRALAKTLTDPFGNTRSLGLKDSYVVGSAIIEGVPLITADRQVKGFLRGISHAVESFL
jgi:RHS repeat-associated protein